VTVVSGRGAARVLGRDDGGTWAWRVGREWFPIDTWRLTPCGLIASTNDYLTTSAPLWFAAEGEQWGWWCASPFGEAVAAAIKSRSVPFAPGHPAERCPAPYCRRAWSELAQALGFPRYC